MTGRVSATKELPKGVPVGFAEFTHDVGTFRTIYNSKKILPTTASYWGTWYLDWDK